MAAGILGVLKSDQVRPTHGLTAEPGPCQTLSRADAFRLPGKYASVKADRSGVAGGRECCAPIFL
jgi:hypothetical protein